jgi:hypothetical protein
VKKYYGRMEALVWNTRLRIDGGGGGAGKGGGLLNGPKTKRVSLVSVERLGVGLFTMQG